MKTKLTIQDGYIPSLNIIETEKGIKFIKDTFEKEFSTRLNLERISAPLFVHPSTGLNDNLNGVERPVSFEVKDTSEQVEIVHSLAKWKRYILKKYEFEPGSGIYTDMNAIRRDEDLDNIHSIYVDQWDWEKVILKNQRTHEYLKKIVKNIVESLYVTQDKVIKKFKMLTPIINKDVFFISSQELENLYPSLSPKERENKISEKYKTVFISQIGKKLKSGEEHDKRAPDYDDWELNGDILVWYPILNCAIELSSMGIRVDKNSLEKQLYLSNCEDRKTLEFHKLLLEEKLPLTIGGGIGQSRICMILLNKAHIGEVQVSIWPKDMIESCKQHKINLL